MSFGKARFRGASSCCGPRGRVTPISIPALLPHDRGGAALGEPAAAESSLRQGRGSKQSRASFPNPIQNSHLLHTSSKTNNFLRSDQQPGSGKIETKFSQKFNRISKTNQRSRLRSFNPVAKCQNQPPSSTLRSSRTEPARSKARALRRQQTMGHRKRIMDRM